MNVGFAMLYPYRGSIHNMIYISKLFEKEGHESFFIKCNSSVPYCYNRMIKGSSKFLECAKCRFGGIGSFPVDNIYSIDKNLSEPLDDEAIYNIVSSTSFSLHRIETNEDCLSAEVIDTQDKLAPLARIVYKNAVDWIQKNSLDLVFIFNGRLDMPRAILEACKSLGIPFITLEASYPGVALEVNEDCRSLKSLHSMTEKFKSICLNERQSYFAGKIATQMLNKKNLVWRLYNTEAKKATWPVFRKNKILVVPSSNHEFMGVPDWASEWDHPLDGVESVINKLGYDFKDCVVRGHPNWSESIGVAVDGHKSERLYKSWSEKTGAFYIGSESVLNTNDLISEADFVIVQYGTAGIEAGLLGKKVIGLAPSWYSKSDMSFQVHGPDDLNRLDLVKDFDCLKVVRNTLRFLYVFHHRFPRFSNYIYPVSVFENEYFDGANLESIFWGLRNNIFDADDDEICYDSSFENSMVTKIIDKDYDYFSDEEKFNPIRKNYSDMANRRFFYKWLDAFRRNFKSGDR